MDNQNGVNNTTNPTAVPNDQTQQPTTQVTPVVTPVIVGPDLAAASQTNLVNVTDNKVDTSTQSGPAEVNTNGTLSSEGKSAEEIAQGIASGNMINAVQDPNQMINGGKVGTTVSYEEDVAVKKGKKNIKKLIIVVVILLILGGGGYFFYNTQYNTSGDRIDALVNGVNTYLVPIFNDCEKRIGSYDLNLDVVKNTSKYGGHTSGSYGYDLSDYFQINGELDSVIIDEEQLGKTPVKYYFYLNDSKLYVRFEDLYDKYLYDENHTFDDFMNNVKQNDVQYNSLELYLVNALKAGLKSIGKNQSIASVNINGESKTANIVTITLNKNTIGVMKNVMITNLVNNPDFVKNMANLTGYKEDDLIKKLNKINETEVAYDGVITIKLYSGLFNKEFYGLDVVFGYNNGNYVASLIPIANGYKVLVKESGNENINVNLTRTIGGDGSKTSYKHVFDGQVLYKKDVYQIKSTLDIDINIPYQVDKPVVKNSINIKYVTQEDFENIFVSAKDKYNVLGSKIYKNREKISKKLKINYVVIDVPSATEETTTPEAVPAT